MITPKEIKSGSIDDYVLNLDALVASLADVNEMIHLIDAQSLKPLFTSRSILQILGYSVAQIKKLGPAWAKILVHPDDYEYLAKHIQNYKNIEPLVRTRVVYRVKDPKNKWHVFESISTGLSSKKDSTKTSLVLGLTRQQEDSNYDIKQALTDHRCKNCNKLLGKESELEFIEIKCNRCGEFNHLSH